MKSFETFLREKHAKYHAESEYYKTPKFEDWLLNETSQVMIKYAEEWHRQEMYKFSRRVRRFYERTNQ